MNILDGLNDEQKQVVTHESGPLLVIAGAGTGKTKTLTSRILYLLEQGVPADSILALTFTEKATSEMQTRIDMALELSHEEICIKTFHSFSDQILKERAYEIGLSTSYRLLDSMNQWLFLKKHLFSLDLNYYRPLGNPSRFISSLLQHFQRLKDESITPEMYKDYAEKVKGKASDEAEQEDADKLLELAIAFKQYQDLLLRENAMDFADLTYYALKLLKERKSVLQEYQKQYDYILVDEFQDTNFAQSELVFLLSEPNNNLMVVGDDDQSIYKWRGASLSNIFHFLDKFPKSKQLVLTENYRSTQSILDASYALIQNNNPDRLELKTGISKKLRSQQKDTDLIQVNHLENVEDEAALIIKQIIDLNEKEVPYSEMALLLRSNALAAHFVEPLKAAGIPFKIRSPRGFFRTEVVKDILAFFRVLRDPDDDVAMYRLLTMSAVGMDDEVVQDYLRQANKVSDSLTDLLLTHDSNKEQLPGLKDGAFDLVNLLKKLRMRSFKSTIGTLLYDFFDGIGLLQMLQTSDKAEDMQALQHLSTFSRVVAQFDAENHDPTPRGFLEYLELLEEADMSFEMDADEDEQAVQILTIHSSKGLEFEVVFVPSLVQNRFPSIKRKDAFEIPIELTQEVFPDEDFHIEEERRLMYVAMTRSKRHLFLSFSNFYGGKRRWKPSLFLNEMKDDPNLEWNEYPEVSLDIKAQPIDMASDELLLKVPHREHRAIKRFSYSQFDTFKTCPLKYQFRYVYRLAPPDSHASQFGSSVHNTLNEFYQHMMKGETVTLDLLKELYEKNWLPYGYTSKAHQMARKKKGWEMMENFYENNSKPSWKMPAYLERPFSVKVDDASISGRIDRIDQLDDGTYEVIDYKTGKSRKGQNLSKDLQLGIYAYVCEKQWGLKVSKLTLYFLDDDERQSIHVDELKMDEIVETFRNLSKEIPVSNFDPQPGFHCGFCEYRLVCAAATSKTA